MVSLNSKMFTTGNLDTWWYNISNPSELKRNDLLSLNLWDAENKELIKKVEINLDSQWMKRIQNASTHTYKNREICKIHIHRSHTTKEFEIYFGVKTDGVYSL